jgi:hypothetical protein
VGGEREEQEIKTTWVFVKTTTWVGGGAVMSTYNEDETMTLSLVADLAEVRLQIKHQVIVMMMAGGDLLWCEMFVVAQSKANPPPPCGLAGWG